MPPTDVHKCYRGFVVPGGGSEKAKRRNNGSVYFFCMAEGEPVSRSLLVNKLKEYLAVCGFKENHVAGLSLRENTSHKTNNETDLDVTIPFDKNTVTHTTVRR